MTTTQRRTKAYWLKQLVNMGRSGVYFFPVKSSAQKAIIEVLNAQGVPQDSPLRAVCNDQRGDGLAIYYNEDVDEIFGAAHFRVSRRLNEVCVINMHVLKVVQRRGVGRILLSDVARHHPDMTLAVHGAVEDAKPFYAKLGAVFPKDLSLGTWSREATDALRRDRPIAGHIETR